MRELFHDTPDACDNTLKIAARCNVEIEFGKFQMPEFPLPEGFSDADYLRDLCYKKLPDRYETLTDTIKARLDYELKVIHDMGYDGYFLIVHDFINFARSKKIPVGPGRGSAAGSLVAYVLGITALDPIKYNLLFERFLNPERVTLPDIDVDLCYLRRDEVIDYVRARYGVERVSQIATFGTLAAKAAIRDVVRVLDISYNEGSRLVKMIPNVLNISLDDALKKSKDLRGEYENNPDSRRIIDFAKKLEGLPRHLSVHAAGVVISKLPLDEVVPLQLSNGVLVTQYDKDKIEELGLLKMDFLGLRTLTIVAATLANIKKSRGVELELSKIPLRDAATAKMLTAGETGAVFQMESAGMTALVKELAPECFEDLIPTVALYRPGPLGSGMVADFIKMRNAQCAMRNEKANSKSNYALRTTNYELHFLHPKLEPILRETFGVILYQEQVMQIVQTLAGFTLGQADILRRAMFLRGCESNGVEKTLAEKIFELLSHFADYGFNKSHSAAYGLLAWQTAYLKAHYPAEFLAAMMSDVQDADKVTAYIELARRMGIKILPAIDSGAIRFGLSAIKTVGEVATENVIQVRESGGKFKSLTDFCGRVDLKNFTRRSMENLIKCGAFDSLNKNRAALLESLEASRAEGAKKHADWKSGAISLFGDDDLIAIEKPSDARAGSVKEILAWEKETLGFYITGHPLDDFREKFSNLTASKDILDGKFSGKRVKVGGIITDVRRLTTKRGDSMAYLKLEDFGGVLDVTLFPNIFYQTINIAVLDNIVVVEGRVDDSQLLADKVTRAEDYAADFWLTIPARLENPATFDGLKQIFSEHAGNSRVFLNRQGTWKKIAAQISDSATLRKELGNLLGTENIRLY